MFYEFKITVRVFASSLQEAEDMIDRGITELIAVDVDNMVGIDVATTEWEDSNRAS